MHPNNRIMVFANRSKSYAQDTAVLGEDGVYRSSIYKKTLEELQEKDPAIELIDLDEFVAITEAMATTDPVEIDEARYWYLLEVLPPGGWTRLTETESFFMTEFTTGRVTNHIVRLGQRYFSFEAPVMANHVDRVKKVRDWLDKQEAVQ